MRGTIEEPDGEKIRMILKLVPDFVSIICYDGVLFYNSQATHQIHGNEEADLAGKKLLFF